MRVVGPLMKHSALFVIAILALPFALMLRKAVTADGPAPANPAEERKARSRSRGERIAKASFATLAIAAVVTVGVSYAHDTRLELSPPERIFEKGVLRIPVAAVSDGKLHRFAMKSKGKLLRFIVIRKDKQKDEYAVAMDACTICNDKGYGQIGERIVCLNCLAEINPESIGEGGGCNPIPLVFARDHDDLRINSEHLEVNESYFKSGFRFTAKCPGCRMEFDLEEAGGCGADGKYYCKMPGCAPDRRPR
jgi:uncharacterized membrane protein